MINFAKLIECPNEHFKTAEPFLKVTAFSFEDDTHKQYHALYPKEVQIRKAVSNNWVIDFGGYCVYNFAVLFEHKDSMTELFCIDAGGRNHSGDDRAVYIYTAALKEIINYAIEQIP